MAFAMLVTSNPPIRIFSIGGSRGRNEFWPCSNVDALGSESPPRWSCLNSIFGSDECGALTLRGWRCG